MNGVDQATENFVNSLFQPSFNKNLNQAGNEYWLYVDLCGQG